MRQAIFTVTLSKQSPQQVTVDYRTKDGTAVAPDDYTSVSGSLTFEPGELEKTITVPLAPESESPLSKYFDVELVSPTGGNLSRATGRVTIPGEEDPIEMA